MVCYELNGSVNGGTTWRQNITSGTVDGYPVLDQTHNKVYNTKHYNCSGTVVHDYTNSTTNYTDAHSWGNATWTWGNDGKSATCTRTCSNNSNHTSSKSVTLGNGITSKVKTAATCTTKGTTTYTATATVEGTTYTATKDVADIAINPNAHNMVNGECTHCHMRTSVTYRVPTYNKNSNGVQDAKKGIASWSTGTAQNVRAVTSSGSQVTWTAGWYYVSGSVTLTKGAVCSGAVHLILCDGANLTVTNSTTSQAGINVTGSNSLTIYAQSEGSNMGALSATGNNQGAGIGGGNRGIGQNITINGGTVTATVGGTNGKIVAAGIGGGDAADGQNITINCGTVTAIGGNNAAGIGGGTRGIGQNITINGGNVTATGNSGAAGIGNGQECSTQASGIYINGGNITATGGTLSNCSGIGNGNLNAKNYSGIYISTACCIKAGTTENPTTDVPNTGADLASSLYSKRYVKIYGSHVYSSPSWSWAEDGSNATLTLTCSHGETRTLNTTTTPQVTITSTCTATCTSAGTTTYNASVTYNGTTYNDQKQVATAAFGHDFDKNGQCTHTGCTARQVSHRVPTYNTNSEGVQDATKGIASWSIETAVAYPVTSSGNQYTDWGTEGQDSWYYVSGTVSITRGVRCWGNVHLILCDGANLTVQGSTGNYAAAIRVDDSNSLTIYAQSEGASMGMLSANGAYYSAGIGGCNGTNGQNITINGGTVTATGYYDAAGIGGGQNYNGNGGTGQNITINGGTVTAIGGSSAAGIGGGYKGSGQNITINGGTVTASGGSSAAGIGGGTTGTGQSIKINGGTVTATGGSQSSAGIGNGYNCSTAASNITVNTTLTTKAGTSANPTTVITNDGGDLAPALAGKRYVTVEYIPGDLNNDGNITIADVTQLILLLNQGGTINNKADVNKDGSVTVADVEALRNKVLGVSSITQ